MFDTYIKKNKIFTKTAKEIRFDYNTYFFHLLHFLKNPNESLNDIFRLDPRYIIDTPIIDLSEKNKIGKLASEALIKKCFLEDIVVFKNIFGNETYNFKRDNNTAFGDMFNWDIFINKYKHIPVEVTRLDLVGCNMYSNK